MRGSRAARPSRNWSHPRMSRQLPSRNRPGHGSVDTPPTTIADPDGRAGLNGDQLDRWADLIAEGRGEFPTDLAPSERDRLLVAVRRRLRDRLVRHTARAVAARLHREAGPRSET